jgi:hypothetical protein
MTMAYEADKKSRGYSAGGDLSTKQYYAVKMNASEEIILASDANDRALGVLQDAPAAQGRTCEVAYGGISKAVGGAVIVAGVAVEVGAGGKFVTLTTGPIAGIAITGCGADEEQFSIDIIRGE